MGWYGLRGLCWEASLEKSVNNLPGRSSEETVEAVAASSLRVFTAGVPVVGGGRGDEGDGELVRRARGGEAAAFEGLVVRYRARLYGMIYNMTGNEADSWDLTQEVFLRAWRALPQFEDRAQFYTWLHRIAHNAVCDWLRRQKVRGGGSAGEFDDSRGSVPEAGAVTVPRGGVGPDEALSHKELGERIREALEALSPEHRAVILLKELDGMTYQEIAESVGCSVGTVMSRLFYARKRLQVLLADLGPGDGNLKKETL